jgi:hypothetical protein
MGKCCLSIFDFISKNVVVFQKGFFGQDLRNLITRQEFPMRNLLRQRKCSGEPIACTLCIYAVISKCVKTLFFGTSPVALGLKKYLWFRFPFDPIFFCRDPIFSGWLRAAHTACQNSVCCHTNYWTKLPKFVHRKYASLVNIDVGTLLQITQQKTAKTMKKIFE